MGESAQTWLDVLHGAVGRRPGQVAFTFLPDGEGAGQDLTLHELDRRARTVAAHLQRAGMAGQRVVLWYPSGPDYLAAFFGCLYAGAVAVPAYPPTRRRSSLERVRAIVADAAPGCALTTAAVRDRLPAGTAVGGRPPIATDELDPELAERWSRPDVGPDTVAFLQYTSGSTGSPRGVVLTHANLLANSTMIGETFGTTADTHAVSWLPMYHDMGLIGVLLHVLHHGGRTTLMSPVAFVQNPVRWLRAISRTGASAAGGPNFAFDLCVDRIGPAERAELDLSRWELAFNGAEPIRPQTLERFTEAFAPSGFRAEALTACYGLAEATLLVSGRRAGAGSRIDGERVSCGHRPSGTTVEIVDPATGVPCPPGTTGEIWVRGPAVGQGYWNDPEATERTFRATLAGTAGPRHLRTGDLGYLRDGELYVAGRQKDLVIVRGRNHHPQDVERTAEAAHPAVRRGGTAAFAVPVDGIEALVVVAEIGPREAGGDLAAVVDAALDAIVAEHDVRPHRVALIRAGTLPRTSSGKVQRHACRTTWLSGGFTLLDTTARTAQPPAGTPPRRPAPARGSMTRLLAAADALRAELADLLRVPPDQVDLDAPLARLGLDSMTAVALQHRLATRLDVQLPLDDVVTRTGAELVEQLATAEDAPVEPAVPPAGGDHPLPANQAALWLQYQLVPDTPAHLLAMAVRIDAAVDPAALGAALRALADRHDALRTTFPMVDGAPVARLHAELPPRFDVVDAGPDPDATVAAAAHTPFDPATGPLLRVTLLRAGPTEHLLVLAVDHLVADLWSLEVLLDELAELYAGRTPAPAGSYRRHVREQHELLAGREEELTAWWRAQLDGAPTLLRFGTPNAPRPRRMRADAIGLTLDHDARAAVEQLAARLGVTRHAVLLAAYQALLGQWTGQHDLVVGTPAHGRSSAAHGRTVGLFVDVLALRGRPGPDTTVAELVDAAHRGVRDGLAHAALPFARLVEHLRPERHPDRPPLVQAVLNWQQAVGPHGDTVAALVTARAGAPATVAGLPATTLALPGDGTQFELVLTVAETAGGLAARLQFDPDRIDPAEAAAAAGHLSPLLVAFAADPGRPLRALPRLPRAAAPASVWDGGPAPRPAAPVHEQLTAVAAARPDAVALVDGDVRVTYRELDRRVRTLARRLRAAGAGPGDLVALYLDRSAEFAVAAAAVLRTGAAYLPLDVAHPAERRRYVLDDAAPRFALVAGRTLDHDGPTVLDMTAAPQALEAPEPLDGPVAAGLDALAYVIYTSGSSGRPKGVPVTHRGLATLLAGLGDLGFGGDDVWMLFHSCAFDFSVWELWGALVHGGTAVVVPPEATVSAGAFWDLAHRHRVTVLNQTPAVFREMTAAAPDRLAGLAVRHVILGGEKLEPAHLAVWRTHGAPSALVTNMYGLTETTIVATRGTVVERSDGVVPIGAPLAGTTLCLLDAGGGPVPPGEPGEIGLSGPHLTHGYLGRPGLTAERFTPHPTRPGQRLYRTGDLARRRPDGALEYLGRADDQVQVRGYRVEPGEVVAALLTHPAVADAVVLAETAGGPDQQLVAYLVPAGPDAPGRAELRTHLRRRLPEYMVPGRFLVVDSIPLTGSGKVDRRALPGAATELRRTAARTAPTTPTEARLVALATEVAELAEHDRIGRDDDLFDLGWHSLLMARLAARIRDEFAVEVPLLELFAEPTVGRISALVDAAAPVAPAPTIPRVDRSRYRVEAGARLPAAMRG